MQFITYDSFVIELYLRNDTMMAGGPRVTLVYGWWWSKGLRLYVGTRLILRTIQSNCFDGNKCTL